MTTSNVDTQIKGHASSGVCRTLCNSGVHRPLSGHSQFGFDETSSVAYFPRHEELNNERRDPRIFLGSRCISVATPCREVMRNDEVQGATSVA